MAITISKSVKQEDYVMAQLRLNDTTADSIRDRYQTLFAKPFTPNIR